MVYDSSTQIMHALRQGRYAEAERLLARWLEADPYDAGSRSLRALCLGAMERWPEALAEGRRAVADEPEMAYGHWVMGMLLADTGAHAQALEYARRAAELAPESADPYALAARCLGARKDWAGMLARAEEGLEVEPDHAECANLRALALQVQRSPEAEQAFIDASAADPGNAFARAGRGWQALRGGMSPDAALPHFYHALEIDPTQEWARDGLATALKARNPVYRGLLRYFLWMDRLSPRTRWLVVVGGLVGYNVLNNVKAARPELGPFILPLLLAYGLFVLMTWVADPLFDGLLALDPQGRAAVTRERAVAGATIGAMLVLAIAAGVAGYATGSERLTAAGIFAAFLTIPTTGAFHCHPGWPRLLMGLYTAGALTLGSIGLAIGGKGGLSLTYLAMLVAALGSWVAQLLAAAAPGRGRRGTR